MNSQSPELTSANRLHSIRKSMEKVGAVATAAALTASCNAAPSASTQPENGYTVYPAILEEGTVKSGVNLRHDPEAIVIEGYEDNACDTLDETLKLDKSHVAYAIKSDENGDWIGINTETPGIPEACKDDGDHKIWFAEKYFTGDVNVNKSPQGELVVPRD